MLDQLATQLQVAANHPISRESYRIPSLVLMSFLLTGWLVYSGTVQNIANLIDLHPSVFAATPEVEAQYGPSVTTNPYTFDQNIDPDWYYVPGYGYSK